MRVRVGIALAVTVCALAAAATATAKSTLYQLGSDSVSARAINADGTLTPLTGSPFSTGGVGVDSVVITPDGSKLFVANQVSDDISRFQVNADGTLTAFGPPTPNTVPNPLTLTVTPDGRFLYVVAGNSVSAMRSGAAAT